MNWEKIALALIIIGCFWWLWHVYRSKSASFTVGSLSKSFFTMGVLALLLIVFIALCVLWLRV